MTLGWIRAGGVICLLCGVVLVGMGVYTFTEIMRWRITPYEAGFAVLWILLTGLLAIAMGVQMLFSGRRPVWLARTFVGLLVVAFVFLALRSGMEMLRLYR